MCGWRAPSGGQYIYIFGKKAVKVYLLQDGNDRVNVLEVCLSHSARNLSKLIHRRCRSSLHQSQSKLKAAQSHKAPVLCSLQAETAIQSWRINRASKRPGFIFDRRGSIWPYDLLWPLRGVSTSPFADHITIYDDTYTFVRKVEIAGVGDYELNDVAIYQGVIGPEFPSGAIAYAIESDALTGFGISSLESVFSNLDLTLTFAPNTAFTPRDFV